MGIHTGISDGWGTDSKACVTERGQLVVAPLSFSTAYPVTVALINTAYNFVPPVGGRQFVVTDILLYANKGVGASDATVEIYEADATNETTVVRSIMILEMLKQTNRDITGLNLLISAGKWLNIKTDDNTIFATVMGYYVNS
jgi:hypothetical protein